MNNNAFHFELDAVLNTLTDGVIMIDGKGLIERYNPACEKIFGYDSHEVIGRNINCLMPEPYHSHHNHYISNYQTTRNAKIIGIGREVSGKRKNGTVFPMYLSVGEVPNIKGYAYVGIIRDLTEDTKQRAQYEHLQQAHFHLSRVSAMDEMGAAIAHEINQPLTAIMNYLEAGITLLQRTTKPDKDKLASILEKSSGQADRAAQILSRLRRFIETGDVEKKMCSLETLIQTSVDLILPQFKMDNIDINIDLDDALPQVLMSEIQIQQVLVNLIKNACEAMSESPRKTLEIRVNYEDVHHIKIGIIDTGTGLTDSDFKSLYKPFSSDKTGGLGVGLSICRSIIANHEGRLWAEQNTPQGACFYFTLPIG